MTSTDVAQRRLLEALADLYAENPKTASVLLPDGLAILVTSIRAIESGEQTPSSPVFRALADLALSVRADLTGKESAHG